MTKRLNSFFECAVFLILIGVSALIAFNPNLSASVLDGINLWFACVLPSLFPFFIITACFSYLKITGKLSKRLSPLTNKLFRVNGSVGYALFMSIISGYPMGAKVVSDLKNSGVLSNSESVRATALCSTSSPMFLISSVGIFMFNSVKFGGVLFLSHMLAVLIIGIIFSFYKRKDKPTDFADSISPQKIENLLYETVYSAVISALVVGGMITLFYLITQILLSVNALNPIISAVNCVVDNQHLSKGLVLGLFECTQGLKCISLAGNSAITLACCAFVSGFGGLSVIMQSLVYLKGAKIKTAPFLLAKLLMAVISFIIALILSFILL